jgi:CxxC-x17-CxxC domain-containing protein
LSFSDRTLICRDCSSEFTFTSGEQEFYAGKGLTNDPVRCPSCRASRKSTQSRTTFDQPEDTGYVRYGTFASYSGRNPRQRHPATCAECGQMTEVPFVPRNDRPVYCSSCYNKIRTPRV